MDPCIERRELSQYPGYLIGADGVVWSSRRGGWKPLKGRPIKGGYLSVAVFDAQSRPKNFLVHRLVLLAFVGEPPEGCEGCHDDDNPRNNALGNLRWDTPPANYQDRVRHGTDNAGDRNGGAKLTAADVATTRQLHEDGVSRKELRERFNVGQTTLRSIITGRSWKCHELQGA